MSRARAPQDVVDVVEIKPWAWRAGRAMRTLAGRLWAAWSWLLVVALGLLTPSLLLDGSPSVR